MLCVDCKKNTAVIFLNKPTKENPNAVEGLCYDCAKKRGINPFDILAKQINLSESDIENITKQFGSVFQDISENLPEDMDIEALEGNNQDAESVKGMAVPLGSIFSNMFDGNNNTSETSSPETYRSGERKRVKVDKKPKEKKKKFLDTYGTNLTLKARNNELDMVIGRDKEIQRITQILNRRSKNNPCLIGEPGVGKTAIAQGLAIKIAAGNVPAKLLNKEVYLLDMTSVLAGTQFRGQFEGRMKGIIDECKTFKNIILVIDEIHNIIGSGDSEHSMNAADILKPSLSNGEIQLIGTTTLKEF